MKIDVSILKYVDEFRALPQGENHTGLLSLANRLVKTDTKYRDRQTLVETLLEVGRMKWGTLDDDFYKDVENTADKALDTAGTGTAKHAIKKTDKLICDYDKARDSWRAAHTARPAIASVIEQSDLAEKRIFSKDAMWSLYKNADSGGHVWIAEDLSRNTVRTWASVGELQNRSITFTSEKYFCACTYGDELHATRDKVLHQINQLAGVYERTDSNVKAIVAILMEMDAPMVQAEQITDIKKLDSMAIEELQAIATKQNIALSNPQSKASVMADIRKAYRERIFTDTCLILDALSVKPTTVTFSGGKSYHCLFRLTKPITPEVFEKSVERLKSAYRRIGLDDAVLTKSRACRFPCGCTQLQAQDGDTQRVMYLDDCAEVEFSRLVEAFERLADEITPEADTIEAIIDNAEVETAETKQSKAILPLSKGDDGKYKTLNNNGAFLESIGIYRIKDKKDYKLILRDAQGWFEEISVMEAADIAHNAVVERGGEAMGEVFNVKLGAKYQSATSGIYNLTTRPLNKPLDSMEAVYAPFQNGLLKISKDGFGLLPYDGTYDIDQSETTMNREFVEDAQQGEFETFLKHACGEMLKDAEWQKRFEAIRSWLGYMPCRFKEEVNYLTVFVESDNAFAYDGNARGRTGKSIIQKAIGYWRHRHKIDLRNASSMGKFAYSGMADGTDYLHYDDAQKTFDTQDLFSVCTDGLTLERKCKDVRGLSYAESPKMTLSTNYFPKGDDSSFLERVKIYELSNYYKGKEFSPRVEFNHRLFDDWNDNEWHKFDTFICCCIRDYLNDGRLKEYDSANIHYKSYLANVCETLREWLEDDNGLYSPTNMATGVFDIKGEFEKWHFNKYGHLPKVTFSTQRIADAVKKACTALGYTFEKRQVARQRKDAQGKTVIGNDGKPVMTSLQQWTFTKI